ncbi:MAG: hypothetical protein ACPGUY_00535 [Akkermansiaceae bacterium]
MNAILEKLAQSASDAGQFAQDLAASGMRSVSDTFRGVNLFGALSTMEADTGERDETHYILVPDPAQETGYSIYSKRILPPDIGVQNSLPKARVFHLPDAAGKAILETQLIKTLTENLMDGTEGQSDVADGIEKLADQIDRETDKISGGLVLIGGAVAIVNPLLGVGIAAKALLPSIGAKASKAGAEFVGGKLRKWNMNSAKSKKASQAKKEVSKLKPELFENPIIRGLDAVFSNPSADYDPAMDQRNWPDSFTSQRHFTVAVEAIQEVYKNRANEIQKSLKHPSHRQWLQSFLDESVMLD